LAGGALDVEGGAEPLEGGQRRLELKVRGTLVARLPVGGAENEAGARGFVGSVHLLPELNGGPEVVGGGWEVTFRQGKGAAGGLRGGVQGGRAEVGGDLPEFLDRLPGQRQV
jgi:hypothetical protein